MEESRKSQSSFEYLLIVALTFVVMVPTIYLFYNYAQHSSNEIDDSQITKIGRNIIDTSESVFYSGTGSKIVIDFSMPGNIRSAVIIDGRELAFNISTYAGISESVFFSTVNLSAKGMDCDANVCRLPMLFSGGAKKMKIEAINQYSVSLEDAT